MRNILYLLLLISSSCIGQVRDYNLRIGSDKDPDSTYCLVTATTGSNFAGRGQFKSLPQLAALIEGYLVVTETQGIDDVLSQSEAFTTNRDINAAGYTFEIKTATERVLGMNDAIDTYYVGKYNNGASLQFASTNLSWITNSGANSLFGINTVAPTEALDVIGNGLFSGTLTASNLSGTNTGDQDLSAYALSSNLKISSLLAASASNTINNVAHQQEWQWDGLAAGSGLKLSANTTAAASSTQKLFELNLNGTNATAGQSTYAAYLSNTHAGSLPVNYGLYSTATGGVANFALKGEVSGSSSIGAWGLGDTGYGVRGDATSGIGLYSIVTSGTAGELDATPATTNTVHPLLNLKRRTSGTAAGGIGGSLQFYNEADNGTLYFSNAIQSTLSTAANATRTSQLLFTGVNSATTQDLMSLAGSGQLTLSQYTTSNFNGGAAADSVLVVTSAGVVKKRDAGAFGGGGAVNQFNEPFTDDVEVDLDGNALTFLNADDIALESDDDITLLSSSGDVFIPTLDAADGTETSYLVRGTGGKIYSKNIFPADVTLGSGDTEVVITAATIFLTGHASGNTISTINTGTYGQTITLIFLDALITITDSASGIGDTVNLSAAFTSTANDVLTLVYIGTSWVEVSRSVN